MRIQTGVAITFVLAVFGSSQMTSAAPMPLSPASLYFSSQKEIFRSPLGFSIHAADTRWTRIMPPKNNEYLKAIFRAPTDGSAVQAALTVRSDKVTAKTDLTSYAKKWLKDYPRLGFQVLAAKKVRIGEQVGFMIDMINSDAEMQL